MKYWKSLLVISIIIIDQISKYIVNSSIRLGDYIDVIPGFFRIKNVHNTGAAWSMFEGKMFFFYIITILFLIAMVYFYRTNKNSDIWTRLAILLMGAGAVGNFIDRIYFQYVRDFLDFVILGYDFPVFNVADIALCIGVGCLILSVFLDSYGGFLDARNR